MFAKFALFALLLLCGHCINWEAYGNFTDDNITIIRGYVQNNFPFSTSTSTLTGNTDTSIADFTVRMSDYLNGLWDKAWNVVVSLNSDQVHPNLDTIMYGYGFRKHWIWINGYKTSDGTTFGIVVWKDYNCHGWFTFNGNSPSQETNTFTGTAKDNVVSQHITFKSLGAAVRGDIWETARRLSNTLTTSGSDFSGDDKAFTIIATESNFYTFYGRFCAKAYYFYPTGLIGDLMSGIFGIDLFLQMRWWLYLYNNFIIYYRGTPFISIHISLNLYSRTQIWLSISKLSRARPASSKHNFIELSAKLIISNNMK